MTTTQLAALLAAAGVAFLLGASPLRRHGAHHVARVRLDGSTVTGIATDTRREVADSRRSFREVVARRIGGPLRSLRGDDRVERDLMLAGLATLVRAEEVLAAQALGAVAGAVAAIGMIGLLGVEAHTAIATFALFVVAGFAAPRAALRRRAAARQARLEARASDALDLMTLCVESGLAFDAALAAVGDAIPAPLGDELSHTLAEIGLGLSRREALENLRRRNESPTLDAFVVAVSQADELGTPIGRVLTHQAAEARTRRRQLARERAAKLPVRILIPTVLLVFPPTFVVLLAPAFAGIRAAF